MATSTVGADAATGTLRVSLPSNDENSFWGTTSLISFFQIPTTTMTTTTMKPVEIDCPDGKAATPKSHRRRRSDDRCQYGSSSAGTSGPAWWEMIPIPPALLLWSQSMMIMFGSVYYALATVARMVPRLPSCVWSRSQPCDSIDRPREGSRSGCGRHAVKRLTDAVDHGEDLEKGNSCNDCDAERQLGSEEKQSKIC